MRYQNGTSSLKSQFATSNLRRVHGGQHYLPYAFTEQGVAVLSSVLRSKRAVMVNVEIMPAFVAAWPGRQIVQASLAQLTWYHHIALLARLDSTTARGRAGTRSGGEHKAEAAKLDAAANLMELGYGG